MFLDLSFYHYAFMLTYVYHIINVPLKKIQTTLPIQLCDVWNEAKQGRVPSRVRDWLRAEDMM
jgi:hypothetical protein